MQLYNRNYIIATQFCVCSLLIIYTHSKEMTSQFLFRQWSMWNGMQSADQMETDANKQAHAEPVPKKNPTVIWWYFEFNVSDTEKREVLCKTCKMKVTRFQHLTWHRWKYDKCMTVNVLTSKETAESQPVSLTKQNTMTDVFASVKPCDKALRR